MSNQNSCFLLAESHKSVSHHELSHMYIDSTQQIVKHQNISIGVKSSRERNTGFLTSREGGSLLTDHSLISVSEKLKISFKAGVFNDLLVFDCIKSLSKDNVVPDSIVDNPWLLSNQTE